MIEVDLTPQDGPQRPPAMQNQVCALVAATFKPPTDWSKMAMY